MNTHTITVTEKAGQYWASYNGITVTTADSPMTTVQTLLEGLRPSLHSGAHFYLVNKTPPHQAGQGTHTFIAYQLCGKCKKRDFDNHTGCHMPTVFSPAVGDWLCNRFTQNKDNNHA